MTYRTWQKRKTLNARLLQPELPVCSEEINAILRQILKVHFPEKNRPPSVFFGRTPTLAYIEDSQSEHLSAIWMHIALNDPATPDYVFSHVLKHELLHTRIIPRQVNGVWSAHPPEFWEEESRIAEADTGPAWQWIDANFNYALKRDNEHECIWVNNRRMKELLQARHCGGHDLNQLRESFRLGHKELRFGFRKQALRAFDPKRDD
jgi:hypothetical protein